MEEPKLIYKNSGVEIVPNGNLFIAKLKSGGELPEPLKGSWTSPVLAKAHVEFVEAQRRAAAGEDIVRKPKTIEEVLNNGKAKKAKKEATATLKKLADPASTKTVNKAVSKKPATRKKATTTK